VSDFNAEVPLAVSLEDTSDGDDYYPISVWVGLTCTSRSRKGFINGPPEVCYPPEGAEFRVDHFAIGEATLTCPEFQRIFGEPLMNEVYEEAHNQAQDCGRF